MTFAGAGLIICDLLKSRRWGIPTRVCREIRTGKSAHASFLSCSFRTIAFCISCSCYAILAGGQEINEEEGQTAAQLRLAQIEEITTAERLMIQDIEHSIEIERHADAIDRLIELSLKESPRLVSYGKGPQGFVYHFPLSVYLQQQLLNWDRKTPGVLREYRRRVDPITDLEWKRTQSQHDAFLARRNADRYFASSQGSEFALAAADIALANGWLDEAAQLARRANSVASYAVESVPNELAMTVPWEWIMQPTETRSLESQEKVFASLKAYSPPQRAPLQPNEFHRADEVLARLLLIQRAKGASTESLEKAFKQLVELSVAGSNPTSKDPFSSIPVVSVKGDNEHRSAWSDTYAGSPDRVAKRQRVGKLTHEVNWSISLPVSPTSSTLIEDVVAGLRSSALSPITWQQYVLIPLGDHLRAFEMAKGTPWPVASRSFPLWRSQFSTTQMMIPSQLPIDGQPHVTLSREGDVVALRDGSPVTGWLPVARRDQKPLTRVVAIDLKREGRLLEGFPWTPKIEGLPEGLEVEGCPLLVNSRIYVPLLHRDAANMQSYIACLNLSGQLLWASPRLAAARFHEANGRLHVSHSLISYSQGTVYFHASLGTVAALDAESGGFRWLTQYPRFELPRTHLPLRRGAQRDISSVLVHEDLIYAAPADSDRVFALSRSTGQLIWALAPGEANDGGHLIGVTPQHLIVSGDRLYWIDRIAGGIVAAFPTATSQQPFGSLPTPRGIAPALMTEGQVIFPTEDELWVFNQSLNVAGEVVLEDRVNLKRLGIDSGHCTLGENELLINSDRMLSALRLSPK